MKFRLLIVSLIIIGLILSASVLVLIGLYSDSQIRSKNLYPTATITPTLPPIELEPLPTPQPRPEFINNVSPPESSVTAIDVYKAFLDMGGIHFDVRPEEVGYNNSICVNLNTGPLLENNNDFTDGEAVLHRISVFVDEQELTDWNYVMWTDTGVCSSDFEGGCNYRGLTHITNAVGYDWIINCWTADVDAGNHHVLFQFRQTSGNVQEYQWSFGLTNESVPLATLTPVPGWVERRVANPPLCDDDVESYDHLYPDGVIVADLLNACGRPDIIYVSTSDFRLVHLVYLSEGLEAQIFKSASFGFGSSIHRIEYFAPKSEDEYWNYPSRFSSGGVIEEIAWEEAFGD
jgi:hypothetical protein